MTIINNPFKLPLCILINEPEELSAGVELEEVDVVVVEGVLPEWSGVGFEVVVDITLVRPSDIVVTSPHVPYAGSHSPAPQCKGVWPQCPKLLQQ
jgi:hypothetical protein